MRAALVLQSARQRRQVTERPGVQLPISVRRRLCSPGDSTGLELAFLLRGLPQQVDRVRVTRCQSRMTTLWRVGRREGRKPVATAQAVGAMTRITKIRPKERLLTPTKRLLGLFRRKQPSRGRPAQEVLQTARLRLPASQAHTPLRTERRDATTSRPSRGWRVRRSSTVPTTWRDTGRRSMRGKRRASCARVS